jgi:6,7-dimethyl-8-ribityllumazine synthase
MRQREEDTILPQTKAFFIPWPHNLTIMATSLHSLSEYDPKNIPDAKELCFGLAVSRWNEDITLPMSKAALETLLKHGALEEHIHTLQVPGTFELPMAARLLAQQHKLDAIICIGCVIKGETDHDVYINQSVANGLIQFSLMSGIPTIFGVLTPNTHEQALQRAGGQHGNKGVEAAITAIQMGALRKAGSITKGSGIGFGTSRGL